MSKKQKILLAPGFTETGSQHFRAYGSRVEGSISYRTLDFGRNYSKESVKESWARQIGEAAMGLGDDPIVVAHSLSTGPALIAATELAKADPNNNISLILDSPIGTAGSTPVSKLVLSATIKTFRNIFDSFRSPYGANLSPEQITRLERFRKVIKDMGAAARQLANVSSTIKEIKYAAGYDIKKDLQAAVEAGVDVHILLNNKDDMDNTNNPKRWRKKVGKRKYFSRRRQVPSVPPSLADDGGELLAPVSTRSDGRASHDSPQYAPTYGNKIYEQIINN